MKTPTIVILSPSLRAVSGISTHVNLLNQSTLASEYELVHFNVGREGRTESSAQRFVRLLQSPFHLAWLIVRFRPAVVHINTAMDPKGYWRDMWYVAVSRLLRRKVLFQIHGGSLPEEFFGKSRLLRSLLRRVLRASHALVLLSQVEYDAYKAFVPGARVELVPNAIAPEGLLGADTAKATRGKPLHLAYVGRLVATKGVLEAIEATRILRDRGVAVHLSIAGSGPFEGKLREAVAEAGLSDRVTFRGPLFGEEKNLLWREADLFAFPTYHKEGLPYALLEAMAAAAVPVTNPVGAIPDVMRHGVHGLFVPPRDPQALADTLARLDADRAQLARMAAAGRQRVLENYSIARLASDFRRLYATL